MNGLFSHFVNMSLGNKLCTFCFDKSRKIVFVSETVQQQAKVAFGNTAMNKTTVIPNGISFKELQKEWSQDSRETNLEAFVLFYGRLVTGKGISLLFRAWAHLQRRFPKITLMVVGAGPLSDSLRGFLRELAIGESVEIRGYMPRHDLISVIRRSLAVVLPSAYEGASFAMLEAMACSKPVVALDYPFAREIIKNYDSGLLASPGDEMDLARKIQLLIQDEDLRVKLGQNAHRHVYQNHNWDKLIERYIALYQSLANSRNEYA
jgi:glycosyltransferase involved in cell wall biosynthesis